MGDLHRLTRWAAHAAGLLLAAVSLLAPASAYASEETKLVILHTTDLHGAYDGWDHAADRAVPRGLTRIATLVQRTRAEGAATLLLDAGDCIQGGAATVWGRGSHERPDPMMSFMNRIGYDAMAVGNHEFDFGLDGVSRARHEAHFPWLAANIVRTDGGPAFEASMVKMVNGIKVGVVGVCTPAVPMFTDSSFWAGLRFLEPIEPARREVERLRRIENCDVVVLLAHTGLERDPVTRVERRADTPDENWGYRLAEQVRGVDAVILGHTHVVVAQARVAGQLVTQAGKFGENLGRIELKLQRPGPRGAWVVMDASARVLAIADSVAEDSTLVTLAAPYRAETRAALDSVIGTASAPFTAPSGRAADGSLWRLIHRAQFAVTGADLSLAALPDPGASIPAGPVTQRALLRLYPYENTLGVVQLTGTEIRQVLEKSASLLADYTFEHGRGLFESGAPVYNFDALAGATYTIDLLRPVGERIVDLRVGGRPIEASQTYKVAVNSYREFGGGGFPAIPSAPRVWQTTRTVRELIADCIRAQGSITPESTTDWTLSPAQAALPERAALDLLVRQHLLSTPEAASLDPAAIASRTVFSAWLLKAMGPRGARALGAAHGLTPDSAVTLDAALEACERAARDARYLLSARAPDAAFRRSLVRGTSPLERRLSVPQALTLIANLRFPTIRVLETTDFHGAVLQTGRDRASDRVIGGTLAMVEWVERLRAENPEGTVLIDGGDCYQGTMISNLQFGRPIVEQMNALGYTATAIGNHEFDWTADTLVHRIDALRCASLGANIVERRTNRRPRWARADTVVTRLGMRLGVLGFAYRYTPSVTLPKNVEFLRFDDDSAVAARLVPALRKRADVVVGVGHIPADLDSARHAHGDLWRDAQVPGFDAWFGGHSHNQVLDWAKGIPFMIAGSHGQVVGVCDFVVDGPVRKVVERRPRLQLAYLDEIPADSAWQTRIARWNADIGPIAGQKLCRNARRLGRDRGGESSIGGLVSDAMRAEVQADVAMQNSGGLRADLAEGDVTKGSIYEVMPFDNTLYTMDLTGAQIRSTLEEGLSFGRVTQVSGIRLSFDTSRIRGSRLVTLTMADGSPVDDTRTYKVVVNNFMGTGGDNYATLMRGAHRTDTGINVRDALERYVVTRAAENGGVLDYHADGRVTRTGGPGSER